MNSISKISIVGTGKMAFALVDALHKSGIEIVEVYGRNSKNAEELAKNIGAIAVTEIQALNNSVDAFFLLVSDDAIELLSSKLPSYIPHIHTSGVTNVDVLSSDVKGVVWPVKSINPKSMANGFNNIPITVEGTDELFEKELLHLVNGIGASGVLAKSSDRSIIHLAAVFTDNFANHCLTLSQQILKQADLDSSILRELAKNMAEGASTGDSFERQTGVAVRGDLGSQQKHLDLIKDESLKDFYKFLSSHIAKHHEL